MKKAFFEGGTRDYLSPPVTLPELSYEPSFELDFKSHQKDVSKGCLQYFTLITHRQGEGMQQMG